MDFNRVLFITEKMKRFSMCIGLSVVGATVLGVGIVMLNQSEYYYQRQKESKDIRDKIEYQNKNSGMTSVLASLAIILGLFILLAALYYALKSSECFSRRQEFDERMSSAESEDDSIWTTRWAIRRLKWNVGRTSSAENEQDSSRESRSPEERTSTAEIEQDSSTGMNLSELPSPEERPSTSVNEQGGSTEMNRRKSRLPEENEAETSV